MPIALVFPDSYRAGMSSLAIHTLYHLWNASDEVVCERVFGDWDPPLSLESGAPLGHFPVLAFSIPYELSYFNVIGILRKARIPARAADRDETHPLIIAGGPAVSANPEPLSLVLDAVLVGEVEPVFEALSAALQKMADGREAALAALSQIPGMHLPEPGRTGARAPVFRQWLKDLDSFPTHSRILSARTEFADMGLIEIARGCGRACHFCLAGYSYRPPRERSAGSILQQAESLLKHTDRLGLVSAAVSDHSQIDVLATELRRLRARISVSSLRTDPISETLVRALAESGTQTLTIAPEAGSERLRQAIHKSQTEADILHAVELAARYRLAQVKLYFMLGLPSEEQEDLAALVDLAGACASRFPRKLSVNIAPFVPKAHTPFQRRAQLRAREVQQRLDYVERRVRKQGIAVRSESPAWAEVQGMLARGDQRVGEALLAATEPSPNRWRDALAGLGLTVEELLAARPAGTPLPWDYVRFTPSAPADPSAAASCPPV